MLFPALTLFFLFLLLSAFFSSSETAFISANPYKLDYLEKKGSKRAKMVKRIMKKVDNFFATILVGNTLVNAAAASTATYIFVSFIPNKNHAVLLATAVTTILILLVGEITPKTYAAYNPIKISFLFARPVKLFIIVLYPVVRAFTFILRLAIPSSRQKTTGLSRVLNEEEIKVLLAMGSKDMSSLRQRMITGVLDIGSRPVREIMIPRPQVKAIEVSSSFDQIFEAIISGNFSRFPVYRGRLDNIEGVIHAKDIIPYLHDNKAINIKDILRKPLFVPESASIEKVLLKMQETASHLVFVVDEFGSIDGIVSLEDILEEIVGEIQDEYDAQKEEWFNQAEKNVYLVNGRAPIKDINQRLPFELPERKEYTTLNGFLFYEFGRIPQEGDILRYKDHKLIVEKMSKRHISLVRIISTIEQKENQR